MRPRGDIPRCDDRADSVLSIKADAPGLELEGFRWSIGRLDEGHVTVVIQHSVIGLGPLRMWRDGWTIDVCLHDVLEDQDAEEASRRVAGAVEVVHSMFRSGVAAAEMALDAEDIADTPAEMIGRSTQPSARQRIRASVRGLALQTAVKVVGVPLAINDACLQLADGARSLRGRSLEALDIAATALAVRLATRSRHHEREATPR